MCVCVSPVGGLSYPEFDIPSKVMMTAVLSRTERIRAAVLNYGWPVCILPHKQWLFLPFLAASVHLTAEAMPGECANSTRTRRNPRTFWAALCMNQTPTCADQLRCELYFPEAEGFRVNIWLLDAKTVTQVGEMIRIRQFSSANLFSDVKI